jgi:UDP-N-acetylglucosamine diphosphorylase / glucose-1-phosphate thymidylyltransferase / UDP-N-acetylgalactosamine diphosphorylase / glucosamine-1-phosphate N-acetyltransferase / galactosamine-1-phosphate N-acetyltransferase
MQVVVLAAGAGTRMHPLTLTRPKVLLPVAGSPLIQHVLERAAAAGATAFDLIVHHGAGAIKNTLGKEHQGIPITYHEQGEARGTGHALTRLDPAPSKPFLLVSGDTLVATADLQRLIQAGRSNRFVIGAHKASDPTAYGALETQGDRLVKIHEKSADPPSDLVNTGTYLMEPAIIDTVKRLRASARGEIELTDAVDEHAKDDEVHILQMDTWTDVGRPWHLLDATQDILAAHGDDSEFWSQEGTIEPGVQINGNVRVEKGAILRTGSVIEGPVVISAGARVGPLAYVRAGTIIGPRCHVGAHTELKNTILFEDTNTPHLNYVGDSVLGAGVNLGAGTVIANLRHDDRGVRVAVTPEKKEDSGRRKMGAVLGDHVKTGINVSLDCGTVIGPGALLAPGQSFFGHLAGDRVHYGHGKSGPKPPR